MYYNGDRLPVKTFAEYVDLYLGPRTGEGAAPRIHERFGDRWEVCVSMTEGQFQQVGDVWVFGVGGQGGECEVYRRILQW